MATEEPPSIVWIRRDLRITDNTALIQAARRSNSVIPVYVVSTWQGLHAWTGNKRQQFLCESLASLARNLESIGGRLIIRQGDPVDELLRLAEECGAKTIHFNCDPDPFGKAAEVRLSQACKSQGIQCEGHHEATLHQPSEVLTLSDQPYRVFTPFLKKWLTLPKAKPRPALKSLSTPQAIPSLPLPTLETWGLAAPTADLPSAGERAARARLKRACDKIIHRYKDTRDFPGCDGTSRISQDLRFGLISVRSVFRAVENARAKASPGAQPHIDCFISEIAWREFYFAILHYYPEVLDVEFNPTWRGLPWREADSGFEAWKAGLTGFPIVDAAMRELLATGFMHNRSRMITAMFLTKDLHMDWKAGESHFMQHLLDGEIASNNGGWQWSAGTGADAAPYFRIQNPWTQGARFDSKGAYIKKWIPELADTDPSLFHQPPKDGRPIATNYPLPILDHSVERKAALAIFQRHKQQTSGR